MRRQSTWGLAVAVVMASACLPVPRIDRGSLTIELQRAALNASLVLDLSGPEQLHRELIASPGGRAHTSFELIRPGLYLVRVDGDGDGDGDTGTRRAAQGRVQVYAGQRARLRLGLQVAGDAGTARDGVILDAIIDASLDASRDTALRDVPRAEGSIDQSALSADAGSEDSAVEDAAPPLSVLEPPLLLAPDADSRFSAMALSPPLMVEAGTLWSAGGKQVGDAPIQPLLWRVDIDDAGATAHSFALDPGPDHVGGIAAAIVRDDLGQMWACGQAMNASGQNDMALWSLSADGASRSGFPLIRSGDAGGVGDDMCMALLWHPSGALWLGGYAEGPAGRDMALWKYDRLGRLQAGFPLIRSDDAGGPGDELIGGLALGDDGDLWAVGQSTLAFGQTDVLLWRFDTSGQLRAGFPVSWDSPGHGADVAAGIVADDAGGVWLGGASAIGTSDGYEQAMTLWRYDGAGSLYPGYPWRREPGGVLFRGQAMVMDSLEAGALWVTGGYSNAQGRHELALWRFVDDHLAPAFPWRLPASALGYQALSGRGVVEMADGTLWMTVGAVDETGRYDALLLHLGAPR